VEFSNVISTSGEWLRGEDRIIRSSLAAASAWRGTYATARFPAGRKGGANANPELIKPRVEELPEMQDSFSEMLQDLSAMEKQVLVERHLISREHAAKSAGSAVVMNRRQTLSIMINEEDHLRMQSIRSGLQLRNAFKLVDKVDSALESKVNFAYDPKLGYLTACPTNVGTGMRASAMLHLPALVVSEQINQVIQAVNKIGLAVRGLYGEGTEAMGNLSRSRTRRPSGRRRTRSSTVDQGNRNHHQKEHDARQVLDPKEIEYFVDQ
jgi:protein arginine kinase